jgi:two-component system cell cycle response regulator
MNGPTGRSALPAMAAGSAGLIVGILALVLDQPWLGVGAGVLALLSGFAASPLARRLDEQGALQQLVEEELRTVRAEARGTEADLRAEIETLATGVEGPFDDHDPLYDDEAIDPSVDAAALFVDPDTGLFSEPFFAVTLDNRIAAARRHLRPIALVLIDVVEGLPAGDPRPAGPATVAAAVRSTLREADTACRLSNGSFAVLLEDTPENGAIWTVERIRRSLGVSHPALTLWAGVACYPAHAFSPGELLSAAGTALISAREWRQDRIEVAAAAVD